jgi:hypothetical protein
MPVQSNTSTCAPTRSTRRAPTSGRAASARTSAAHALDGRAAGPTVLPIGVHRLTVPARGWGSPVRAASAAATSWTLART